MASSGRKFSVRLWRSEASTLDLLLICFKRGARLWGGGRQLGSKEGEASWAGDWASKLCEPAKCMVRASGLQHMKLFWSVGSESRAGCIL